VLQSGSFRAVVRGRVQGVGYREFVRRTATQLGLCGWTRNLTNRRSVEVVATGERSALDDLLARLAEGPHLARVSDVAVDWGIAAGPVSGFVIRY